MEFFRFLTIQWLPVNASIYEGLLVFFRSESNFNGRKEEKGVMDGRVEGERPVVGEHGEERDRQLPS